VAGIAVGAALVAGASILETVGVDVLWSALTGVGGGVGAAVGDAHAVSVIAKAQMIS
jgi:hypothetical protein